MAHRVLVGGTSYNVVSGKSMVSGTAYNIKSGRVLAGGTAYNITFQKPHTAMLYSDGSMVFQRGDSVESGKTLVNSYTGFESVNYEGYSNVPWNMQRQNIVNVTFKDEISPVSLSYWFNYCLNITSMNHSKLNWNSVTNMAYAFYECEKMPGTPTCGSNVTNMHYAYYHCTNLTGSPVCGSKVTSMRNAYYNCFNLNGKALCGSNVNNFSGAYYNCTNITGSPVCGSNVTNMRNTYLNCKKLTGSPVCGANVTDMYGAYVNCSGLTGKPACGDKVTDMSNTYRLCSNLAGPAICGNNVKNMSCTYFNCKNIGGNAYFYSPNVSNVRSCFQMKDNAKRLNIYVPSGSTTNTKTHLTNTLSIVGMAITWTDAGSYQYNTAYNVYIYPVSNVAASRAANGD